MFDAVVCGQDSEHKKPHPAPLQMCLAKLGIDPAEAIYIGDSREDIHMAKAAGVLAIAVPGPYPNREMLAGSGADFFAKDLAEAITVLDSEG